jgi:hypothetical protein
MQKIILTIMAAFAVLAYALQATAQVAVSGGPEGNQSNLVLPPTPTPTPPSTPTPFGRCPEGLDFDFASSTCKECIYQVLTWRESIISDARTGTVYGVADGSNHRQTVSFSPTNVVLGRGTDTSSPFYQQVNSFLNDAINICYTRNPWEDPSSVWATGWDDPALQHMNFSQCVAYRAHERFSQVINSEADWMNPIDPEHAAQFFAGNGNRWHFSDITEVYQRDVNGQLVRHETPDGVYFEQDWHGMVASFYDRNGNRLRPADVLDPTGTSTDMWRSHDPKLRDEYKMCYTFEVRGVASPLSLFMPGCDYRELEPTIVEFPLNPHNGENFAVWKASKCMPLLVYDPEHTGKITSGAQLLGEWTNGSAPTYDGTKKPWRNGFQVLSTFDKDGDGTVSGKELGTLGVWSDENRNGISEPGEVKSALEFGIKQLRYSSPKSLRNGDLFLEKGYKLKHQNKAVDGMLIDWYGATAKTEKELITRLPFNIPSTEASPIRKYRSTCKDGATKTVAGGWRWWLDNDPEKVTKGYLTLDRNKKGELVGNSFSIQFASKEGTSLAGMVTTWPLEAKERTGGAELRIPSSKGAVISDVSLSGDGMVLTGTTRSSSGDGATDTYSWHAERVGCTPAQSVAH